MPAALDIDREAVRVLVVAVGVREAARQLELPTATVAAWSARADWLAGSRPQPAINRPPASMQPKQPAINAITPAQAMANSLSELGKSTRLNLAKALSRGAEHVATLDGASVLECAEPIGQLTRSGVPVFGWSAGDTASAPVTISIHLRGMELEEMSSVASGRVIENE